MNENERTLSEVIASVRGDDHMSFHSTFRTKQRETSEQGDEQEKLFQFLGDVFSMQLCHAKGKPFAPIAQNFQSGKRSLIPSDLTEQNLDQLTELLSVSENPAFVARVSDVLWVRRKSYFHAKKAIKAYLECVVEGKDSPWPNRRDYLRRAAHMAAELGAGGTEERVEVVDVLMRLFQEGRKKCFSPDWGYWPAALVEIMLECQLATDWNQIGSQCEETAKGFPVSPGCSEPRRYCELAVRCYRLAHEEEKVRQAQLAIARHLEEEAGSFRTSVGGSGLNIAHRLTEAIQVYQNIGGCQKEVNRLIRELKGANQLAMSQMKRVEIGGDVTPLIESTKKEMANKTGSEALMSFVDLYRPQSYDAVLQEVEESCRKHPFQALIGSTTLVPEGNVASKAAGILEDEQDALMGMINRQYVLGQVLVGGTVLETARSIINEGSDVSWRKAVRDLLQDHPFVPGDRRDIYERALIAGLEGDGLIFVHLIIPQLENSLRTLFDQKGIVMTAAKQHGIQEERDLNWLLDHPESEKILGKDLRWEMRSLLTERSGPNLRNRVCHGLATSANCTRDTSNFLLWLVLFILIKFARSRPFS